jgi:hypothetical protein
MRLFSSLLASSFLLVGACTGNAVIDGVGGAGTGDDDDAVGDDDDAGGDDDDAAQTNPFEGSHERALVLLGDFGWGGGEDEEEVFCVGFLGLDVDAEGVFEGGGECEMEFGEGRAGAVDFEVVGTVDMDGAVEGTITATVRRGENEPSEAAIAGNIEDALEWADIVDLGWGDPIEYSGKAYIAE